MVKHYWTRGKQEGTSDRGSPLRHRLFDGQPGLGRYELVTDREKPVVRLMPVAETDRA
jgi:hypothetical protein